MKKILCSILLFTGVSVALVSCSSGAYVSNSSSNINNSVNPLNPLTTSQFTWPALGTFSASINGTQWVADSAIYVLDTNGANIIYAFKNSPHSVMNLYMVNTWANNLYNMGHLQYNTSGAYTTLDSPYTFHVSVLGNSGELYLQQNDTAVFQGRFYFQAVDTSGNVMNITNGYFDLHK